MTCYCKICALSACSLNERRRKTTVVLFLFRDCGKPDTFSRQQIYAQGTCFSRLKPRTCMYSFYTKYITLLLAECAVAKKGDKLKDTDLQMHTHFSCQCAFGFRLRVLTIFILKKGLRFFYIFGTWQSREFAKNESTVLGPARSQLSDFIRSRFVAFPDL